MEKNVTVSGDQARILLHLMCNENVTYRGDQLLDMAMLLQQFLEISNVQPPVIQMPPSNAPAPQ